VRVVLPREPGGAAWTLAIAGGVLEGTGEHGEGVQLTLGLTAGVLETHLLYFLQRELVTFGLEHFGVHGTFPSSQ